MKRHGGGRSLALVEIIIAIGVLAVVSVFVLEMFVRASGLTNKARDRDWAGFEAQSLIEMYKAQNGLLVSLDPNTEYYTLPQDAYQRYVSQPADNVYEVCFTADRTAARTRDDQGYVLTLTVTPQTDLDGTPMAAGRWEDLTVSVVKLTAYPLSDDVSPEIFHLTAGVYFPPGEEAVG